MARHTKIPLALRVVPALFRIAETAVPFLAKRMFIHFFFSPVRYKVPMPEQEAASMAEKFIIKPDQKNVQVYSWGKGKTILLIHGWAGRATQFRKFIKPLNDAGFRVLAFDGPAHGRSEGRKTDLREFRQVIEMLAEQEKVQAIVAHSFGGSASLYAIAKGLPVNILVNIASPTIGDEIINTYLKALNASPSTGEYFKTYVKRKTGKSFDEFTSLHFIKSAPDSLKLMLVHDHDDQEVTMEHAERLANMFPHATLLKTSSLGHRRILKDEEVIDQIVTFVVKHSS